MRNNVKVIFKLDRLICYEEADGWGSAEPYMWTVFFKIDGTTCRLNNLLMLEGTATIFTTPGSHGNLGDTDVDAGDTVQIPAAIGEMDMILTPIPVPDFVKQQGVDDVTPVAGCIVILMEEDNVTDDGANAGHQSLNTAIQNALDGIIPTLGFLNQEISDEDIENLSEQVQSQVEDAIKNQQNFFENIWSWLNADDTIGTVVWKFSGDKLLTDTPIALQHRWPNEEERSSDHGDWEIFGAVTAEELPACPADVVKAIFDSLFQDSSSGKSMEALYDFRRREFGKYRGLGYWWQLAQRNTHYLKRALKDREVSEAAVSLLKSVPDILKNRNKPVREIDFDNAMKVLHHILNHNE
ncbi:MAG: hypothetical protein C0490_19025, partial [Marivirga sp.]|nr:hypothetical protein [Marivirga sp.]